MRTRKTLILFLLVGTGTLCGSGGAFAKDVIARAVAAGARTGHLTVTGEAEVRLTPKEADVILGVKSQDRDVAVAKADSDKRVQQIVEAAKNNRIENKFIRTNIKQISLQQGGYEIERVIVIRLREIAILEKLLFDLTEAGANMVYAVQFRVAELPKYRDEANILAVKAARQKAEALAAVFGQKIGEATSIGELALQEIPDWGLRIDANYADSRRGYAMAPSTDVSITNITDTGHEPMSGQISMKSKVTVTFELGE